MCESNFQSIWLLSPDSGGVSASVSSPRAVHVMSYHVASAQMLCDLLHLGWCTFPFSRTYLLAGCGALSWGKASAGLLLIALLWLLENVIKYLGLKSQNLRNLVMQLFKKNEKLCSKARYVLICYMRVLHSDQLDLTFNLNQHDNFWIPWCLICRLNRSGLQITSLAWSFCSLPTERVWECRKVPLPERSPGSTCTKPGQLFILDQRLHPAVFWKGAFLLLIQAKIERVRKRVWQVCT